MEFLCVAAFRLLFVFVFLQQQQQQQQQQPLAAAPTSHSPRASGEWKVKGLIRGIWTIKGEFIYSILCKLNCLLRPSKQKVNSK